MISKPFGGYPPARSLFKPPGRILAGEHTVSITEKDRTLTYLVDDDFNNLRQYEITVVCKPDAAVPEIMEEVLSADTLAQVQEFYNKHAQIRQAVAEIRHDFADEIRLYGQAQYNIISQLWKVVTEELLPFLDDISFPNVPHWLWQQKRGILKCIVAEWKTDLFIVPDSNLCKVLTAFGYNKNHKNQHAHFLCCQQDRATAWLRDNFNLHGNIRFRTFMWGHHLLKYTM